VEVEVPTMRWIPAVFTLLVLLAPAGAGPENADREAERLKMARLAMEAQIRLGDIALARGDAATAARAYEEAVALFREAAGARAGRAPAIEGEMPEEIPEGIHVDEAPIDSVEERPVDEPFRAGKRAPVVVRGLAWLAAHQDVDDDGKWDADDFEKHDPAGDKCNGRGGALNDVGVSSLALLAFLGAGYTDRGDADANPYARNVRMGMRYLMTCQSDDGCIGTRASQSFVYGHALATLALCEAYAVTRNPRYKKPAQEAVNYIAIARNPYMGWRYVPRGGDNDTSVTALCVMALKSARFAGLDVDPDAFQGALAWMDKVTDPRTGLAGYNQFGGSVARPEGLQDKYPPERSRAMTAAAMLTRMF
jgi:hypothetical protein